MWSYLWLIKINICFSFTEHVTFNVWQMELVVKQPLHVHTFIYSRLHGTFWTDLLNKCSHYLVSCYLNILFYFAEDVIFFFRQNVVIKSLCCAGNGLYQLHTTFIHEEEKVFFIVFCNFHDQQAEERDRYEFFFLYRHQSSFFYVPSLGVVWVRTSIRIRILLQSAVVFLQALMNSLTVGSLMWCEMNKLKYKLILSKYPDKTVCLNKWGPAMLQWNSSTLSRHNLYDRCVFGIRQLRCELACEYLLPYSNGYV